MHIKPLVSVVLPTHNRPDLLREAIISVSQQTLNDWELIIIDDGSVPEIDLEKLSINVKGDIKVVRHPIPQGGAAAKNTGIIHSKGEYLAFLDDDDLFAPEYLETAIEILKRKPEISTLFMGVDWFGQYFEPNKKNYDNAMAKLLNKTQGIEIESDLFQFDDQLFVALLESVPMAFQRPVTKASHLKQIGLYQKDCLLWDCEWALRAANNQICGLLEKKLYKQRTAGQSYSSKPNRRLDHLICGFNIQKDLLNNKKIKTDRSVLLKSAITSGQNLAWEYINQKNGFQAVKTMINTFKFGVNLKQIKFFLHALLILITPYSFYKNNK
jgi:glycosyltransferase involved in cell wall biosynthesis